MTEGMNIYTDWASGLQKEINIKPHTDPTPGAHESAKILQGLINKMLPNDKTQKSLQDLNSLIKQGSEAKEGARGLADLLLLMQKAIINNDNDAYLKHKKAIDILIKKLEDAFKESE